MDKNTAEAEKVETRPKTPLIPNVPLIPGPLIPNAPLIPGPLIPGPIIPNAPIIPGNGRLPSPVFFPMVLHPIMVEHSQSGQALTFAPVRETTTESADGVSDIENIVRPGEDNLAYLRNLCDSRHIKVTDVENLAFEAIFHKQNIIVSQIGQDDSPEMTHFFVLPLLTFALAKPANSAGPRSIIVTFSARCADLILETFIEFKMSLKVFTYQGRSLMKPENYQQLVTGCDILITTVKEFPKLIETVPLKNCERVVFDRLICNKSNFFSEIVQIADKVNHEVSADEEVQYIFTVGVFTRDSEKFITGIFKEPMKFITTPLLEALHADIKVETLFGTKLQLISSIPTLIKSRFLKTLVICDDEEVSSVSLLLKSLFWNVGAASSSDAEENVDRMKEFWSRTTANPFILVSSDSVLKTLEIEDADCLVSLTLPDSFSAFSYRYLVFERYFKLKIQRAHSYVFIMTNEIGSLDISKLQMIDKVSHIEDKETFVAITKIITDNTEKRNLPFSLCPEMLQFVHCQENRCRKRHFYINRRDEPKSLSKGTVLLKNLVMLNPSYFKATIFGKSDQVDIKILRWPDFEHYDKIHRDLDNYLKFLSRQKDLTKFRAKAKVNELYAIRKNAYSFEVGEVVKIRKNNLNFAVYVNLVNSGVQIKMDPNDLYTLPSSYKGIPSAEVHVVITNLLPRYTADYWCKDAKEKARPIVCNSEVPQMFTQYIYGGKILFALGNTIFVEDLTCCHFKDPAFKAMFSVKKFLLAEELAIEDENLLPELINSLRKKEFTSNPYKSDKPQKTDFEEKVEELRAANKDAEDSWSNPFKNQVKLEECPESSYYEKIALWLPRTTNFDDMSDTTQPKDSEDSSKLDEELSIKNWSDIEDTPPKETQLQAKNSKELPENAGESQESSDEESSCDKMEEVPENSEKPQINYSYTFMNTTQFRNRDGQQF